MVVFIALMKAVFTHTTRIRHDDIVEERYNFPASYLAQVENAVGDFIVY